MDNQAFSSEQVNTKKTTETVPNIDASKEFSVPSDEDSDQGILYGLNDVPPWQYCFFLSWQNCLFTVGGLVGMPLIIAPSLCLGNDEVGNAARANLVNSVFFVAGICTLLQVTIGCRLPIFQGTSFAFLPPVLAILNLPHNQCPEPLPKGFMNSTTLLYNDTDGMIVDGNELWMRRIREVQGAIMIAGLVEILFGLTGFIGFMMRFIGPLTIAPTIALIGLDLFSTVAHNSESHWGIAFGTSAVIILCSQYLFEISIPLPSYNSTKKFHWKKFHLFKFFPVLIGLLIAWLICFVLTFTNTLSNDPNHPNYRARTDIRSDVISNSPWFRVPYPGQWGLPKVTVAGFVAMISAIVASTFESLGDYHACAKMAKVQRPPKHAINRGITIEGFGVFFAGLFGTGTGTTSFSENIAIIGMTRVASRRVMQITGGLLVIVSVVGKIGSVFVTLPDPVIGGILLVMFGMVTSVGLSNLQYVDLNSRRNMFIIGFTLLTGLSVANWVKQNPGSIQTGVPVLDQIFTVLLSSALFIGGILGFIFDNTLPGTKKERGIEAWKSATLSESGHLVSSDNYDLPFPTSCCKFSRFIPILPEFQKPTSSIPNNNEVNGNQLSQL